MSATGADLSGFSRLFRNLIFGWGAYLFVLVTGFVVPRQISDSLGPDLLGIWDVGWATVRYLALGNFGMGGSLSRFVALYRAENDMVRLSKVRTSASILQGIIVVFTALGAVLAAYLVVGWAKIPDAIDADMARLVLLLLGLSMVIRMLGTPAGGTLTGCHRFDIQTSINAGQDVVSGGTMVVVLMLGGGLVELAISVVVVAALTTLIRVVFARRICPEAVVSLQYWDWKRSRELFRFGAKSTVASIPDVLIFQTVVILLAGVAGPAVVAILTRGMALVRHCEHLARRAAQMFVPITSGLIGMREEGQVGRLLAQIGGYGLAMTLPMLLALFFFGDLILKLWMGPVYANSTMIKVLVLGALLPLAQIGTTNVLAGLNAHGRVSLFCLASSAISLLVSIPIVNQVGWSAVTAAAIIGIAWTSGRGLVLPIFLKVRFGFSISEYLNKTIIRPITLNIPLVVLLALARVAYDSDMLVLSTTLSAFGFMVSAGAYWRYLLPPEAKAMILKNIHRLNWQS